MTRARAFAAVFGAYVLASLPAGCTSSDSAGFRAGTCADGGSGCDRRGCATCIALQRCDPATLADDFGDVGTCATRLADECRLTLAAPGTSATDETMGACADALASATCNDFLEHVVAGCTAAPGALPDGSGCNADAQCMSGTCGGADYACGACVTVPHLEEACPDEECAPGASCVNSVCVPVATLGQACATYPDPPMLPRCERGLACLQGTCAAPEGPGGSCQLSECDDPHFVYCNQTLGYCQAATIVYPGGGGLVAVNDPNQPPAFCVGDWNEYGICAPRLTDGAACDDGTHTETPHHCLAPARCVAGKCTFPTVCPTDAMP